MFLERMVPYHTWWPFMLYVHHWYMVAVSDVRPTVKEVKILFLARLFASFFHVQTFPKGLSRPMTPHNLATEAKSYQERTNIHHVNPPRCPLPLIPLEDDSQIARKAAQPCRTFSTRTSRVSNRLNRTFPIVSMNPATTAGKT